MKNYKIELGVIDKSNREAATKVSELIFNSLTGANLAMRATGHVCYVVYSINGSIIRFRTDSGAFASLFSAYMSNYGLKVVEDLG